MRGRVASLADFIGQILTIAGSLAVGALAVPYGPTAVLLGCSAAIVAIVVIVTLLSPRILVLDVDTEAKPIIGGAPYAEGGVAAAIVERS
jgi:hydrogenase-4 membrane subunit HyfE